MHEEDGTADESSPGFTDMEAFVPEKLSEAATSRGMSDGGVSASDDASQDDSSPRRHEVGSIPTGESGEIDRGVENDLFKDNNPVLDMEDLEESVARGSGDVHEVSRRSFLQRWR